MSYIEHNDSNHKCENCGSKDTNVRTYYTKENAETVYHCKKCGYIHWKDKHRE